MKAYLGISVVEECPQESSGEYPVLVFHCSICSVKLTKPPYDLEKVKQTMEERINDPRNWAPLFHPLAKRNFGGKDLDVSSCEYAGKFFEDPLVELREVVGP